jgi:hypothetical protein
LGAPGGIRAARAATRRNTDLLHARVFTTPRPRLTGGLPFTAYQVAHCEAGRLEPTAISVSGTLIADEASKPRQNLKILARIPSRKH